MLRRSSARYVIALYVVDLLVAVLALLMARWLRVVIPVGKPLDAGGSVLRWPVFGMAILVWTFALGAFRVYDARRFARLGEELQAMFAASTAATLVFAGLLYLSYRGLSRLLFGYFYLLDLVLGLAARVALRRLVHSARHGVRRLVLVVGAGAVGQQIVKSLEPCQWMGIEVIGYLDDDVAKAGRQFALRPVLGSLDEAASIVARYEISEVIIALPMGAHRRLVNLVTELQETRANIKVVPDYSESVFYRATLEQFGGLFLIGLKEPVIGPIDRLVKRLSDILLSAVGLIVLSPLLGVLAVAIKSTSSGSVLYKSLRAGEGGREFDMLKFRTMYRGADQREHELISETADGRLEFSKRQDDPRVTPVGRFLRRYSLDELPQLWNVLIGEMSFVGPRPELPSLVAHYEPWQRKRFGVPQGITGWWQINGRSTKAKYLHVEEDLYYIRNYSLLLDLRILCNTLGAVLRGEGAF